MSECASTLMPLSECASTSVSRKCAYVSTPKRGLNQYQLSRLCLNCRLKNCREDSIGKEPVPIPEARHTRGRPADSLLVIRNAQILERAEAGEKPYRLALRFGLSVNTIHTTVSRMRRNKN